MTKLTSQSDLLTIKSVQTSPGLLAQQTGMGTILTPTSVLFEARSIGMSRTVIGEYSGRILIYDDLSKAIDLLDPSRIAVPSIFKKHNSVFLLSSQLLDTSTKIPVLLTEVVSPQVYKGVVIAPAISPACVVRFYDGTDYAPPPVSILTTVDKLSFQGYLVE